MGNLWLIVGPSGSGKSLLMSRLLVEVPDLTYPISYTTREQRAGEVEGKDYRFIPKSVFRRLSAQECFVETTQYRGNYYATSKRDLEASLAVGDAIVLVDLHGARQFKQAIPEARILYLMPPSEAELRKRLAGRGDSPEQIEQRMANLAAELEAQHEADYVIEPLDPEATFRVARSYLMEARHARKVELPAPE